MAKATRATKALEQAGVAFTVHAYDYDPGAASIGLAAAQALGEDAGRVLKTLMVLVDGRLEITGPALSQLEVPTLLLAGRSDAMALARHLAINESLEVHCRTPSDGLANAEPSASSDGRSRGLPPGQAKGLSRCRHRVDLIPNTTRPVAEPGALESIACATTAWFGRTLPPPRHAPAGCIAGDGTAAD